MTYAFTVMLENTWYKYTYTVAAPNAAEAIKKAQRQARRDGGWKRWAVTSLIRGGWIVA